MMDLDQYKLLKFVNTSMDFDNYFRLVNNSKVMEMITERPIEYVEAREDFKKLLKLNSLSPNFGTYKILDKSKGHFIGLAKLEITDSHSDIAELGYILIPEYWGKGIAGQIADHLIQYSKTIKGLKGLFAIIDPKNFASRRILTKNGFKSREFRDFDGLPGEILELTF
ncbi:GNAT family N-acetyltransferase [Sphingobacterium sp. WM]|uniref:GNAT family N-acetyltransferase n=1 Tax=Sphingobacterium sp. WM TaxID=3031802 RepID=UPI00240E1CFB|nr:GNAT family N-acetyltransferase [Sphingobacterium sp. WM]WFB62300.1 GNAT family N-acetyltransferase [Sphingobacterium sp. WM]